MSHAKNKLEWCIRKASKEGLKHRGIRKIKPDAKSVRAHIEMAKYNLKVTDIHIKEGLMDWAVVSIFYSMYHCLLAVCYNFGYDSRNQQCTFSAIKTLIEENKIKIRIDVIERIEPSDDEESLNNPKTLIDLREHYQYGAKSEVEEKVVRNLQKEAKEFLFNIVDELKLPLSLKAKDI